MSELSVEIKGIAELQKKLFEYNKKVGIQTTNLALRNGAKFMLAHIRNYTPVETGRLKKSIKIRASKKNRLNKNKTVGLYITISEGKNKADKKGAFYGHFVHNGHRFKNGTVVPPRPWIENAFQDHKEECLRIIIRSAQIVNERIARELNL
jgi:HK97 gp10 family phage protein